MTYNCSALHDYFLMKMQDLIGRALYNPNLAVHRLVKLTDYTPNTYDVMIN